MTERLRRAFRAAPLLPLSGCSTLVLDPRGPVAGAERTILLDSLAIMLAIVVPTMIATIAFAWWFRAGNARARYLPEWAYSGRIELVVWSIPVLVILFLGGLIWVGSHRLDPFRPLDDKARPLEVQVVALDWKWLFVYPGQGVASVNRLVVPAGVPVHFTITSASVLNSFFVPQLGGMIAAMNGMATQLSLKADRPGSYYGLSSHYSGDGFADMHFTVDAVPAAGFAQWVGQTKAGGPALDARAYAMLARQSEATRPFTYRAVDPRLFDAVLTQRIGPSPGPAEIGTPHADVSPNKRRP